MPGGLVTWLAVLSELRRAARAIEQAAAARQDAHLAEQGPNVALGRLDAVHPQWPDRDLPTALLTQEQQREHGPSL